MPKNKNEATNAEAAPAPLLPVAGHADPVAGGAPAPAEAQALLPDAAPPAAALPAPLPLNKRKSAAIWYIPDDADFATLEAEADSYRARGVHVGMRTARLWEGEIERAHNGAPVERVLGPEHIVAAYKAAGIPAVA